MEKTLDHLNFIISHCGKTMNHLDSSTTLNTIQFFCIGLLERLLKTSIALKTLLNLINNEPYLEFSCGVILRTGLLDALIVANLHRIIIDNDVKGQSDCANEQKVEDFCEAILADGLEHTSRYLTTAKNARIIDNEECLNLLKNLTDKYSRFFESYANDGTAPKVKAQEYYSPTRLFQDLAKVPSLKELSKVFDSYLYFSKYDHFGILYYETREGEFVAKIDRLRKGIDLFIFTHSVLHMVLRMYSRDDSFLNEQSKLAAEYIKNIVKPN